MFTLKFLKSETPSSLEQVEYVTSAHHYTKDRSSEGTTITLLDEHEVVQNEFFLFNVDLVVVPSTDEQTPHATRLTTPYDPTDTQYFDVCYIENAAGKTIDTVRKPREVK